MGHLSVTGTSKRDGSHHANKQPFFQFTTEMLCVTGLLRDPPVKGPSVIPGASCQAGEWWRTAREALPSCILILPRCSKKGSWKPWYPSPEPRAPSPPALQSTPWSPLPPLVPSRTLLTWQWAGTGQEVALNSCHNGRALGCGGSEPRPKRQRRWHGGGRRQVRM